MILAGQWNEMPSRPTLWQVTDRNIVAPLRLWFADERLPVHQPAPGG